MPILGTVASSYLQSTASFESIASTTLTSSTSSFSFTSISGTYQMLQVRITGGLDSSTQTAWLRFNDDTGNNYEVNEIYNDGTNAMQFATNTSLSGIYGFFTKTYSTEIPSSAIINLLAYADTNRTKIARTYQGSGVSGNFQYLWRNGVWKNTSAITKITFTPISGNFLSNTTFALYGLKGS